MTPEQLLDLLATWRTVQTAFLFIVIFGVLTLFLFGGLHRNRFLLIGFIFLVVATAIVPTFTSDNMARSQRVLQRTLPMATETTIIKAMLVIDIACVAALVAASGGSFESAFSPLYFLMPTLAIISLRQAHDFVTAYIAAVSFLYIITAMLYSRRYFTQRNERTENRGHDRGYGYLRQNPQITVTHDLIPRFVQANRFTNVAITLAAFGLSLVLAAATK